MHFTSVILLSILYVSSNYAQDIQANLAQFLSQEDTCSHKNNITRIETKDRIFYIFKNFTVSKLKNEEKFYISKVELDKTIVVGTEKDAISIYRIYENQFSRKPNA